MHEQIFIAALVAQLLVLALRPWRKLLDWEPPIPRHPRVNAIRPGFLPARKKKTPKEKYPAGFA
jgi:hypothetical protein